MSDQPSTSPPIILASGSPSRARLLQQVGLPFTARAAKIDEHAILASLQAEGATAVDIVDALAEFKARRVAESVQDGALILGCDQILVKKDRIFTKPANRTDAADHLQALQGDTHRLLSAAVIYENGEPIWRNIGQARMTMHPLSDAEIEAYLDTAWPTVFASVGAYHAEGYGARLFSRIDGDWYSVLGMPLLNILSFLRRRGSLPL